MYSGAGVHRRENESPHESLREMVHVCELSEDMSSATWMEQRCSTTSPDFPAPRMHHAATFVRVDPRGVSAAPSATFGHEMAVGAAAVTASHRSDGAAGGEGFVPGMLVFGGVCVSKSYM